MSLLTLVTTSGIIDLGLKSVAVMLMALVLAALLGRSSAAWRHLVWCLAVASLLILPVLSTVLPTWGVNWFPLVASRPSGRAVADDTSFDRTVIASPSRRTPLGTTQLTTIDKPAAPSAGTTELRNSVAAPANAVPRSASEGWPWLAIVWATGMLLSVVPLIVGLWQLARLSGQSRALDDPCWVMLVDELRKHMRLRRGVQLRQSEATVAPVTWGALWPVLLVPAEATHWPEQRRRLVVLHELAHIRRWDWLTQLAAHLACALYWFNPLVWFAARQMQIERERACDDYVLESGARASDYADELLTLAASLAGCRLPLLVAVPITRCGALEDRVRCILDSRRNRAALPMAAVCLAAALAVAASAPLAMLHAAPPSNPTQSTREQTTAGDKSANQPAGKTSDKPAAKAGEEPAKKPETPSSEKPDVKPTTKPAAKSEGKTVSIRGKVVDDATGEPIGRLITQAGKFDPANPQKVTWGFSEGRSSARDGSFSTTVRWADGWTSRILADGYLPQPVISSAPPADKNEIEVTIRLKRGPQVRGVVLDHTGKPLKDAAVFAVGQTGLNLAGGQAWSEFDGVDNEARPVRTDEKGRFDLPAGEAKSIAVSHPQFDAWAVAIPAKGEVTVRLPVPARVDIEVNIDGADKESVIFYQRLTQSTDEFKRVQSTRYIPVANPGKLSLTALPPGWYQLCRRVMNNVGDFSTSAMLERQFFEVKAGETKSIRYVRDKGARVRGKVTWPADAKLSGIVVYLQSEKPEKSSYNQHEWTPVFASLTAAKDGSYLTERVAPGTYLLVADAYTQLTPEQRFRSGLVAPSHRVEIKVEIPAEGEFTASDLVLKPAKAKE